jgi:hypothetical protein
MNESPVNQAIENSMDRKFRGGKMSRPRKTRASATSGDQTKQKAEKSGAENERKGNQLIRLSKISASREETNG